MSSCATTTIHDRIEKYPSVYNKLSLKDKRLVENSKIKEGMSRKAVYIAWGEPVSKKVGSYKGKKTETWIYNEWSASSYHLGLGFGHGHFGHGFGYGHRYFRGRPYRHGYRHDFDYGYPHYSPYGFFYNPSIDFTPRFAKKVDFINDKVVSWETVQ